MPPRQGPESLLELVEPGAMSVAEYRRVVRDLVNFLVYVGEPAKLDRYVLGGWVLLFLLVFFVISRGSSTRNTGRMSTDRRVGGFRDRVNVPAMAGG